MRTAELAREKDRATLLSYVQELFRPEKKSDSEVDDQAHEANDEAGIDEFNHYVRTKVPLQMPVEEKSPKNFFLVFSDMRVLAKISSKIIYLKYHFFFSRNSKISF